jgi:hypothetical protein
MWAIYGYQGHPTTEYALKLLPFMFVRSRLSPSSASLFPIVADCRATDQQQHPKRSLAATRLHRRSDGVARISVDGFNVFERARMESEPHWNCNSRMLNATRPGGAYSRDQRPADRRKMLQAWAKAVPIRHAAK